MEKSEEKFSSEDVWGVCVRERERKRLYITLSTIFII